MLEDVYSSISTAYRPDASAVWVYGWPKGTSQSEVIAKYANTAQKASARTIIERWQCPPPEFLPEDMLSKDKQLSDHMLKILVQLPRDFNLDLQQAWVMLRETMQQRLDWPNTVLTFSG